MKQSTPDIRILRDPDTVRLIADPMRLRLLELLRQQPRTVTELAELLDVPRTRLYYHMKLLEEHDLIAVDGTREVSGITERRYRVTAYRFSIDKALLGPAGESGTPLETYLAVILEEVATEIQRAASAGLIDLEGTQEDSFGPRRLLIGRQWYRLTPEDVAAFQARYAAFEEDLAGRAVFRDDLDGVDGARTGDLYEWLVAFYPVVPPTGDQDA